MTKAELIEMIKDVPDDTDVIGFISTTEECSDMCIAFNINIEFDGNYLLISHEAKKDELEYMLKHS